MSVEENKALIRRWYDEWNKGNLEGVLALHSMNFVDHNPLPGQEPGIDGLRNTLGMFLNAFKGLQIEVNHLTAEGDTVADIATLRGTHNGPFMGTSPTGKRFEISASNIWRVKNGEITEAWHVEDNLGLLQQLGLAPSVATSTTNTTSSTRTR